MNTTYFLDVVAGNVMNTQTDPALPTALYLGLSSTAPALDGTGATEPSASASYARVQLTSLSVPSSGVVTNEQSVDFPQSTASWGVMTHYVVYDAATDGNLLMYGELNESRTVESNTIMTIPANNLNLSVLNPS